jgi:hypothetical protein
MLCGRRVGSGFLQERATCGGGFSTDCSIDGLFVENRTSRPKAENLQVRSHITGYLGPDGLFWFRLLVVEANSVIIKVGYGFRLLGIAIEYSFVYAVRKTVLWKIAHQ